MFKDLLMLFWFTIGRCVECGGPIKEIRSNEVYCIRCGAKN
jgi:DNA-directed RNA polymerase subunit RPC12/RpoP